MLGDSRTALAELQQTLTARFDDASSALSLAESGTDLMSVVGVLDSERVLRSTLADSALPLDNKKQLIDQLLAGKVSAVAQSVMDQIVTSRWSDDSDMVDAVEVSAATLVLMGAELDGRIDSVEEELFRFGRAIDANADLQMALTNPAASPASKAALVRALLAGKAAPETTLLVANVAGSLRGRRIQDAVVELSELAAARRGRIIADVRAATPLTSEQESRLVAALAQLHGRAVELNVALDPTVIGGIEVRIGDEVIDGTAATKLEQARRRLTS